MKFALAGKGGAGKTSLTGTLCRVFAGRGLRVLAVDNDMNPNLSLTLGIPAERMIDLPVLPPEVVDRVNGDYELAMSLDEICAAYAQQAPDGITLLTAARPEKAATG